MKTETERETEKESDRQTDLWMDKEKLKRVKRKFKVRRFKF